MTLLNAYDTGTAGAMRKFGLCIVGNCIPVPVPVLVRPPATVKQEEEVVVVDSKKATATKKS